MANALGNVGFIQRAVICHKYAHPVAHLHADFIVTEESTMGFAVGDDNFGQHAKTLAQNDARRQARICQRSPVIGISKLGAGDYISHLPALHVL